MAKQEITLYGGELEQSTDLEKLTLSCAADQALLNLDKTFIGTDDYMGMTYFWHYEYRHYLRDTSYARRRHVHTALLAAGLEVNGESKEHLAIIYFETVGRNGAGEIMDEDGTIAYYKSNIPKSVTIGNVISHQHRIK